MSKHETYQEGSTYYSWLNTISKDYGTLPTKFSALFLDLDDLKIAYEKYSICYWISAI